MPVHVFPIKYIAACIHIIRHTVAAAERGDKVSAYPLILIADEYVGKLTSSQ